MKEHLNDIKCRVNDMYLTKLKLAAKENNISVAKYIKQSLDLNLTSDVNDESLYIAKMSGIECRVENLERKIDTQQKLDLEFYQWFFLSFPDLPTDEARKKALLEKSRQRMEKFILNFRKKFKSMPSFMESILGDMLEEDKSFSRDGNE